jgi:hypothetical protein
MTMYNTVALKIYIYKIVTNEIVGYFARWYQQKRRHVAASVVKLQ